MPAVPENRRPMESCAPYASNNAVTLAAGFSDAFTAAAATTSAASAASAAVPVSQEAAMLLSHDGGGGGSGLKSICLAGKGVLPGWQGGVVDVASE